MPVWTPVWMFGTFSLPAVAGVCVSVLEEFQGFLATFSLHAIKFDEMIY